MGNPLKERRIIAEKGADGKWAYSTDGELEAEAIELLEKLAKGDDLEDNEMFDGVKGKTGEKLKFNAEQLISKLGGELKNPTAEATGKIVKIEERDGVECAIVNVEISIKGEMESDGVPAQVGLSVKGELAQSLEYKMTVGADLAGEMAFNATFEPQPGVQATLNSAGPIKFTQRVRIKLPE